MLGNTEQEAQLSQLAAKAGTDAERLVRDVLSRYLDEDARASLPRSRRAWRQPSAMSSTKKKEMDARVERMFAKP